jgi:hypothetical protein
MKIIVCISLSICCYGGFSQSLPSQVISSGGDNLMMANGSLEWTLGEIMIETYARPVGYLTQGFQQPSKITITHVEKDIENLIEVYPNPVREWLNVKVSRVGSYTIELFNLQGQKLINSEFNASSNNDLFEVDVQPLKPALYLLKITSNSSGGIRNQKIEKY